MSPTNPVDAKKEEFGVLLAQLKKNISTIPLDSDAHKKVHERTQAVWQAACALQNEKKHLDDIILSVALVNKLLNSQHGDERRELLGECYAQTAKIKASHGCSALKTLVIAIEFLCMAVIVVGAIILSPLASLAVTGGTCLAAVATATAYSFFDSRPMREERLVSKTLDLLMDMEDHCTDLNIYS